MLMVSAKVCACTHMFTTSITNLYDRSHPLPNGGRILKQERDGVYNGSDVNSIVNQ